MRKSTYGRDGTYAEMPMLELKCPLICEIIMQNILKYASSATSFNDI